MEPNSYIGTLASGIVATEFDYITGAEAVSERSVCSGWMSGNMGQLNTLIYTSFNAADLSKVPMSLSSRPWQQEEEAIMTQIYLQDYYNKQARIMLRTFSSTSSSSSSSTTTGSLDYTMTPWTTLKEGDTTITREVIKVTASSKTTAARTMMNFSAAAEEKLKALVYKYNFYQGHPRQVAGSDGVGYSGSC